MPLTQTGPAWLFCPADRPERFEKAAAKFGLDRHIPQLRNDLFNAPRLATPQLDLF